MRPRPIEHAPLTEVLVRVAYRVVQLEYRRDPDAWVANKPARTLEIADQLRKNGFSNLYWTLNGAARWLAQGVPLHQWKAESPKGNGVRAFHKMRTGRR